ncbi:SNARE-binding exocyst subunit S6 [Binucleata daphniae]
MNDKVFKSNDILYILDFTKKYYEFLEAVMKVPKESLGDEILGDKENELIQEYTKCATSSLSAWVDNLKNNEIESFFAREASPTLDEEDKYTSLNFINLLQLIKQQLEPIAYNHKIFKVIINEITVCVRQFSKEIVKAMDKDFIPACKQKCNPGYEEYVIMFGNSGLKVTQYVSSLPLAQTSEVKELGNIFINITKKSNYYLSSFVINTCKPVIDKIFTNEWYTDDITKVLVVTVDDFLIDYQTNMSDFSFITFVYELCSELTKAYLKQLVRKRAKIYEDCGYKLNKDLGKFIDLFNKYGEKDEVESNLEAFKRIIPLLGRCNEEMFVVEFKAFLTVYPDIKKEYIKNIVYKKEEMDEESKKRLWVKVKECFKEIANIRTTMFSKL